MLVFDSGLGGVSVVKTLIRARLGVDILILMDTASFPYGEKPDETLILRVPAVIYAAGGASAADLVVVARNTASTSVLAIEDAQVSVPFVGAVPAIRPAATLRLIGPIDLVATPKTVTHNYTD